MNLEEKQKLRAINGKLTELARFPYRLGIDLFYCNMIKDYYTVPSFYSFGSGWIDEHQPEKLAILLNICENESFEKILELLEYDCDDIDKFNLDRILFNLNYISSLSVYDFGLDKIRDAMDYRNKFYSHTSITGENLMKLKIPYDKLYSVYRVICSTISRFIYKMEFDVIRSGVGTYDYKFQIICGDGIIERLNYKEKIFEIENDFQTIILQMKKERGEVK